MQDQPQFWQLHLKLLDRGTCSNCIGSYKLLNSFQHLLEKAKLFFLPPVYKYPVKVFSRILRTWLSGSLHHVLSLSKRPFQLGFHVHPLQNRGLLCEPQPKILLETGTKEYLFHSFQQGLEATHEVMPCNIGLFRQRRYCMPRWHPWGHTAPSRMRTTLEPASNSGHDADVPPGTAPFSDVEVWCYESDQVVIH